MNSRPPKNERKLRALKKGIGTAKGSGLKFTPAGQPGVSAVVSPLRMPTPLVPIILNDVKVFVPMGVTSKTVARGILPPLVPKPFLTCLLSKFFKQGSIEPNIARVR